MSGLALFFRDHLPRSQDHVNDDDNDDGSSVSDEKPACAYHQSLLSSVNESRRLIHQSADSSQIDSSNLDSNVDGQSTASDVVTASKEVAINNCSAIARNSLHTNDNLCANGSNEEVKSATIERISYEAPVDWKEWQKHQKEVLAKFMKRRLLNGTSDHSDNDDTSDESVDNCNDNVDSMRENGSGEDGNDEELTNLETQEQCLATHNLQEDKARLGDGRKKPRRRKLLYYSIPHISETKHEVRYISDIDLITRFLSLPLTLVGKYWPLRDIRRPSIVNAPPRKHSVYCDIKSVVGTDGSNEVTAPSFVRSPYMYCQYDGPMHTCYRQVLSFEIVQLIDPSAMLSTSTNRQRAENCMNVRLDVHDGLSHTRRTSHSRHLTVFFYNSYATAINKIIQKTRVAGKRKRNTEQQLPLSHSGHDKLLLSLENVPSLCIFPNPPSDWYDEQNGSNYCICVGDESRLETFDDVGKTSKTRSQHVRCDTPNMIVTAAIVDGETGEITEYRLKYNDELSVMEPHILSDEQSVLLERYVTYQNRKDTITSPPPWIRKNGAHNKQMDDNKDADVLLNFPSSGTDVDVTVTPKRSKLLHRQSTASPKRRQGLDVRDILPTGPQRQVVTSSSGAASTQVTGRRGNNGGTWRADRSIKIGNRETRMVNPTLGRRTFPSSSTVPVRQAVTKVLTYTKINDIPTLLEEFKSTGQCIVNLYGAVINFKPPTITKRGDWVLSALLVDDSLSTNNNGDPQNLPVQSISLIIFAKSKDQLPILRCAGDIIRLHRVKVQKWNDEYQLLGLRYSSYVVCRATSLDPLKTRNEDYVFLRVSKNDWNPTEDEKVPFRTLWIWAQNRIRTYPTMNKDRVFKIGDLPSPSARINPIEVSNGRINDGDVTVMVSAVIDYSPQTTLTPDGKPCGFLRVWDGTGISHSDPLPTDTVFARDSVRDGDPPRSAVIRVADIITKKLPNLREPKALIGRITNVLVWEKCHWDLVKEVVTVGSFIRLRNVQDEMIPESDSRCLQVHVKSSVTPLPDFTYEVLQLLVDHDQRIVRHDPINLDSGLLPLKANIRSIDDSSRHGLGVQQNLHRSSAPVQSDTAATVTVTDGIYKNLYDLVSGPIGSSFEGLVEIVDLIPSFGDLSGSVSPVIVSTDSDSCETFEYRFALRIVGEQQAHSSEVSNDASSRDQANMSPIDAIAAGGVGTSLFGMTAQKASENPPAALFNCKRVLDDRICIVKVRSVLYEKQKFFLMELLTPLNNIL